MIRQLTVAAFGLTLFALAFSGAAQANPPLSQHRYINEQLFHAAVGDAIRKNCGSISARMGRVYARGQALYRYAQDQGYSRRQISDYMESEPDNDRMKARRDAYLTENGVRRGDAASYCALGRREIAANSPIGELLRSR